jgi:transcription elongation GreA/GreB family factor
MDAELQKLVESGKLTAHAAEQLENLKPGTFCLHKSWGFGRVAEWNLLLNQIVIDFRGKKGHAMQLQYAAENLTVIPEGHFLARKASDLAAVKDQLKKDPVGLVRNILEGFGGAATQTQISEMFLGDLFNEAEWKRWWESTKKLLKKEGYFQIPAKKSEPIRLRGEKISRADEFLAFFKQARQPKEQIAALDQIIRFHHEFGDPAQQLQPIVNTIEENAAKNQRLNPALTFELVIARDDLLTRTPELKTTNPELTLVRLILDEESRLATILPNVSSARERRVLHALPSALGPRWTARALLLFQERHARMVAQIPKVFIENGQRAELRAALERGIREHSATSEMLFWLCKERDDSWSELVLPDLLAAALGALERDQHNENARGSRLRDLLLDDRELIPEMFRDAEMDAARDSMRRLMLTPVFDDLTKRSLLARIIKLYPELGAMITGAQAEEKSEALVVSWSSLHKRKAEYEELIKKKIPENTKEIALARSYGDLSENFEFKAAKQMQAVLMRRKTELEQMLLNARGTAFQSPDVSRVSIGTVVSLRDSDSGAEETYTILGAWDGDPDRNIISYQAAIAQALLGHSLGKVVTLNADDGSGRFAIVSIEAAPLDKAPADPALTEVAVVEVEEVAVE